MTSYMATKLSSEQTELERKLERNRAAFEAWLERKKEEQRVRIITTKKFKQSLSLTIDRYCRLCSDIAIHLLRKLLRKKGKLLN